MEQNSTNFIKQLVTSDYRHKSSTCHDEDGQKLTTFPRTNKQSETNEQSAAQV